MTADDDIETIRASLGLDARVEEEIRRAGERLGGEFEGWVERFYVRILGDPVAMRLLQDDARVVRLRRSLVAWLAETFSLPFDAAYQRAREQIGRTHVRIGMPQHLMIAAMSGLRHDVGDSIARLWGEDRAGARRATEAVEKALDLELALMLAAYGRRAREVRRDVERALVRGHLRRRTSVASREAVEAARCYGVLARRAATPEERSRWARRADEVLAEVSARAVAAPEAASERVRVAVGAVCERALGEVSLPPETGFDLQVVPRGLEADVCADELEIALLDLARRAVERSAGGIVTVVVGAEGDALRIEVRDAPGARADETSDALDDAEIASAEEVAGLHGGVLERVAPGVVLRLPGAVRADRG